jgi:hypothetical protein
MIIQLAISGVHLYYPKSLKFNLPILALSTILLILLPRRQEIVDNITYDGASSRA